ncbi:MAG: hypothetical protein JW895_17600 [Thermoleophilaceae bacterium]|nr:hypothetical protein [Thermoleophilaceae bacterium]
MDTAPIDSYEDAADIFTFGAGSLGMWIFLILATLLFAGFIVRMIFHERRSFAELEADARPPA